MKRYAPQTLNALFLVAGTCIGGGMLALPVATAPNGFLPSLGVMVLAWLAMTTTALFLVEAGFWMKKDEAHLISMTERLLGRSGKIAAWILYLFIAYASLIAYTAGGGMLLYGASCTFNCSQFTKEMGCLVFTLLFGSVIFFNHKVLARLNSSLFFVMIIVYLLLISLAVPKIEMTLLLRQEWSTSWLCLPIFLTAFSFQTMVPSLHPFLDHHAPSIRVAIVGGTFIAFLVYLIWQATVLGSVPATGPDGLMSAFTEGQVATYVLGKAVNSGLIELFATTFAFFALVTSYLGIAMGLYDFLSDGCKIPKSGWGNIALGGLIVLPTLYGSILFERVFVSALDATGGFGDALLNGIIPALMIIAGRYYYKHRKTEFQMIGGKWLLVMALIFYLSALGIEITSRLGYVLPVHTVD